MKVLCLQPNASRIPGGHSVQLNKTKLALEKLGVQFELLEAMPDDTRGFDVAHIFEHDPQRIRTLRNAGLPVAMSTIYWNREYLLFGGKRATGLNSLRRVRMGLTLARSVFNATYPQKIDAISGRWQTRRIACEMADILLPNSSLESEALLEDLNVTTPMHIVPNAVDPALFSKPDQEQPNWGRRDSVVYIGRFEPHKNQLGLIRAMRHSALRLILIGPSHPDHSEYHRRCLDELGPQQEVRDAVDHDALPLLYRQARVHVLPSWFETTGLVSLEAALCGCNIVTTSRGYAREYFENHAWYCDPGRPESIREAIEKAYNSPPRPQLAVQIRDRYTWRHTAEETLKAYMRIVAMRGLQPERAMMTDPIHATECRGE